MENPLAIIAVVVSAIVVLVIFAIVMRYFGMYIQCVTTGAKIGLLNLIVMSLR